MIGATVTFTAAAAVALIAVSAVTLSSVASAAVAIGAVVSTFEPANLESVAPSALLPFLEVALALFDCRRVEIDAAGSKGVVMGVEPVTAAGGSGGGGGGAGAHRRANGSGVAGCDQRA